MTIPSLKDCRAEHKKENVINIIQHTVCLYLIKKKILLLTSLIFIDTNGYVNLQYTSPINANRTLHSYFKH